MTTPQVRVTCYTVNLVPESAHPLDRSLFGIKVEYAGLGRWAVRWQGRCLDHAGDWDYEPQPSSREDNWLDAHRFSSEYTAIQLAVDAAPKLKVSGRTAAELAERFPPGGEW